MLQYARLLNLGASDRRCIIGLLPACIRQVSQEGVLCVHQTSQPRARSALVTCCASSSRLMFVVRPISSSSSGSSSVAPFASSIPPYRATSVLQATVSQDWQPATSQQRIYSSSTALSIPEALPLILSHSIGHFLRRIGHINGCACRGSRFLTTPGDPRAHSFGSGDIIGS